MAEWTQDNLQPLIDKYNEYLVSVGKSYAITLNGQAPTIKGFLSQGAIVLATDVWLKLREFAEWVVDEYDVTDNQTGVGLGSFDDGSLPVVAPSATADDVILSGVYLGHGLNASGVQTGRDIYIASTSVQTYVYYETGNLQRFSMRVVSLRSDAFWFATGLQSGLSQGGISNYISGLGYYSTTTFRVSSVPPDVLSFDRPEMALRYFESLNPEFQGIIADTTSITIPAALPEGTSWGGLAVEGVGDVATPQAVEGAIAEAVTAREQPVVQPVTITLAPDTEINPDNGDTDPPPVVITPFPPADPSAVELGQEILESFEAHFPFSVPWDLYKIFSRLDAEPVAPSWTLALPQVGDLEPVSIVIDVAETPFHALAPTFRAFVGIVICLGLLIAATKWIKR